jgi:hypothetical protein
MNIGAISSSGFLGEIGHADDTIHFTKPNATSSQFFFQPPADGVDLTSAPHDDLFLESKSGGGQITCPEGTSPQISTANGGQTIVVECKPKKGEKEAPKPQAPILE